VVELLVQKLVNLPLLPLAVPAAVLGHLADGAGLEGLRVCGHLPAPPTLNALFCLEGACVDGEVVLHEVTHQDVVQLESWVELRVGQGDGEVLAHVADSEYV